MSWLPWLQSLITFRKASGSDLVVPRLDAAGRIQVSITDSPHALGGDEHTADTLANLNSKISDATLIDTGDSRLSDARTPTAHATTHASGGSDSVKLDDLAAPDDNTDLDATTSAHGLLPKLGGGTTNYLRADGTWAAPAGGGGTDPDAIHDNVSGEIAAITEKTALVSADLLVIEDSAASNAKKRVQVGNLLNADPYFFQGEAKFSDDFWPPVLDDMWTTATSGTGSTVALQLLAGGQVLVRAGNANGRTAELLFGGGTAWQSTAVEPHIAARMKYDGTTNVRIEFEVHYADASNYVMLTADSGGNWILRTALAGTETSVDTGVALDTSYHVFELVVTATSVQAYIDTVLVATSTTNIPTADGTASIYVAATGTGGTKDLLVDAFHYHCQRPT